jgi:hypothetical protein
MRQRGKKVAGAFPANGRAPGPAATGGQRQISPRRPAPPERSVTSPPTAPTTTSAAARTRTAGQLGLGLARLTSQACLPEFSELVMCPGSTEPGAHHSLRARRSDSPSRCAGLLVRCGNDRGAATGLAGVRLPRPATGVLSAGAHSRAYPGHKPGRQANAHKSVPPRLSSIGGHRAAL